VFDGIAAEYDAVRPSYPFELVEVAVAAGSLDRDSAVLEIGCGTGKLTELLLGRGLRVQAVDPGANLVELARARLGATGAVQFEVARFEDAQLLEAGFDAVFSATAFHWVEPTVGWRKVAALLRDDGLLALLTHIAVHDERSAAIEEEMSGIVREHRPATAIDWTIPLTLEATLAAARAQSANVSAVWDVIMNSDKHGLTVPEAAGLFEDIALTTVLESHEQPTDEVIAHLHTTSFWYMLEEDRREPFENAYRAVIDRNGGTYPYTRAAVLMTAKRAPART
jgi:SAM-dependent methyltransferase